MPKKVFMEYSWHKEFFKKAKYEAWKLIAKKKQVFFEEKISESIVKPKVI